MWVQFIARHIKYYHSKAFQLNPSPKKNPCTSTWKLGAITLGEIGNCVTTKHKSLGAHLGKETIILWGVDMHISTCSKLGAHNSTQKMNPSYLIFLFCTFLKVMWINNHYANWYSKVIISKHNISFMWTR